MDWSYIMEQFWILEILIPVLIEYTTEIFLRINALVVSTSVEYTAMHIVDYVLTTWLICQLMEFRLERWNSYAICISWQRSYHSTVWIIDFNWTCCTRKFASLKKLSSQVFASSHQNESLLPVCYMYFATHTRS